MKDLKKVLFTELIDLDKYIWFNKYINIKKSTELKK